MQALQKQNKILPMGPHSSTGSPITFMMRPKVSRPTGTCKASQACLQICPCHLCRSEAQQGPTPIETEKATHRDRLALTCDNLSSDQTVSSVHGNGTNCILSHMIRDFQHESYIMVLYLQCRCDKWQFPFELDIYNSSDDLQNGPVSTKLLATHLVTMSTPSSYTTLAIENAY